jgi:hypothetical protein
MLVGRLLTNGAMNARAVIALSEDWTFKMNAQVGAKCFCILETEMHSWFLSFKETATMLLIVADCTAKSFNLILAHHLLRGSLLFRELISASQVEVSPTEASAIRGFGEACAQTVRLFCMSPLLSARGRPSARCMGGCSLTANPDNFSGSCS